MIPSETTRPRTLWLGALTAAMLFGCQPSEAPTTPRQQIELPALPPKPEPQAIEVDFGPLFAGDFPSRTVVTAPKEPELMKRVLLGPNLVFESSRSTLTEPSTSGPTGGPPTTPTGTDALGSPVDIDLSSLLIQYLAQKGSLVYAPAAQRHWSRVDGTWVERTLSTAATATPSKKGASDTPGADIPTVTFAVRRLGRDTVQTDVIAEQRDNTVVFRFPTTAGEKSLCPAVSFNIPVIAFSAELLGARDGRILARVNELRRISAPQNMRVRIEADEFVENPDSLKARQQFLSIAGGGYLPPPLPPIPHWLAVDVRCRNAQAAFQRLSAELTSRAEREAGTVLVKLFAEALDPLYETVKK